MWKSGQSQKTRQGEYPYIVDMVRLIFSPPFFTIRSVNSRVEARGDFSETFKYSGSRMTHFGSGTTICDEW